MRDKTSESDVNATVRVLGAVGRLQDATNGTEFEPLVDELLAGMAADTTVAELRQTLAHIAAVLDRFEVTNLARERPSQMVTDLIAETRYQIAGQA